MITVRLRTGAVEPVPSVVSTMLLLRELFGTQPWTFLELVASARDSEHVLFGDTGRTLVKRALLTGCDDGKGIMHETVRAVILSAVTGDGGDMTLGSPYA